MRRINLSPEQRRLLEGKRQLLQRRLAGQSPQCSPGQDGAPRHKVELTLEQRRLLTEKLNALHRRLGRPQPLGLDRDIEPEAMKRELECCRMDALNIARKSLNAHRDTLLMKRRKGVVRDDYGREMRDPWVADLHYFFDNFIHPELLQRGLYKRLYDLIGMRQAPSRGRSPAAQSTADLLRQSVVSCLDAEVETMLRDLPHTDLEADVLRMTPGQYEQHCAGELAASGWEVRVTAGAGDQGADITATRDGRSGVFQCKLYSSPLGNKAVQEVHAARSLFAADFAAVVSNAEFTIGARSLAQGVDVLLLHHTQLRSLDPQHMK